MTDPAFYRKLAWETRRLLPAAQTEIGKAQLRAWAKEFDELAEASEDEFRALLQATGAVRQPASVST